MKNRRIKDIAIEFFLYLDETVKNVEQSNVNYGVYNFIPLYKNIFLMRWLTFLSTF